MTFTDYIDGPWRLRAVFCPEVRLDDNLRDVHIWFVGRMDEDQWFAHGLSDIVAPAIATLVAKTIDGEEMDVLLAYGGVSWEDISAIDVAEFAALQREMATNMAPELMETLKGLSRSEIETVRAAEDRHADQRLWSDN